MINNTPEDIILKELNDLKQENEKLKIELEAFKLTQGKTLSIEQYFTQKYLERYTQILNNRIKSIVTFFSSIAFWNFMMYNIIRGEV